MLINTTFSTLMLNWRFKFIWVYEIIIMKQAGVLNFDVSVFKIVGFSLNFLGFWRFH